MKRQDHYAAIAASSGVAIVALSAAVVSFSHMRGLARRAGESELASWLLPISVDGAILAAVAVIMADSRAGRRSAALTWLLLIMGLVASLAANVASAEPTATARLVAAWPPVALALGIEVLAGLARSRESADCAPEVDERAPAGRPSLTGVRAVPAGHAAAGTVVGRLPANLRRQSDDAEAVAVIRQLDAAAPGGRASRLQIQKRLGCGGSKAARLAAMARRPHAAEAR